MSVFPKGSDETICDYCGDVVEPGDECEPDETGHCVNCGLHIGGGL